MILSPVSPISQTVARVSCSGNTVLCSFKERNDIFRSTVKELGLAWNENMFSWARKISEETNGLVLHRIAELAAKLIENGFICNVDAEITEMIKSASWTPEHKRWIVAGDKLFLLRWRSKNDNLYRLAQSLPESRWDKDYSAISVPLLYFSEVCGFADEHEFRFTIRAQELLDSAKREYSRLVLPEIEIPIPIPIKQSKRKPKNYSINQFMDLRERNLTTKTKLFPHQVTAVEKLMPMKIGALFMDMGTGKTRCAIELVARRQQRISKVIWFTPVSLKLTVEAEIKKHTDGESVYVFDEKTDDTNIPATFWYVIGTESISSSNRQVMAAKSLIDADTFAIVDESSYIKGAASKRSMRITELAKDARYRLLLTGTPISQGIEDLYSQMRFLHIDILGYSSFYSFARKHLEYHEDYKGFITARKGIDKVAQKIAPFVYQITKDEALDLPEKLYDSLYFELSDKQYRIYADVKQQILDDSWDNERIDVFRLFTALQRIVSGFHRNNDNEIVYLENSRLEALKMVLSGILQDKKIIIWCKYVESIKAISSILNNPALYYGELNEKERAIELTRFKETKCRYLIATLSTGGHGLTVNEAHYHIFYENGFKYSERIQAEDRSHRIGQTQPVTYIDLVSKSKIDERIQQALALKGNAVSIFKNEIRKKGVKTWQDNI